MVRCVSEDIESPFHIKPSPGKGLGAFASRELQPGELLIREQPLLRVRRPLLHDRIREEVARLPHEAQSDYWDLADKHSDKTAEGIFSCNFFEMEDDGGVYRTICRFNHSCAPNCAHSFAAADHVGELRALRRVPAGEELTVTYIRLCAPRRERQEQLQEDFGFLCDCQACRAGPASDSRREQLQLLDSCIGEATETVRSLAAVDVEALEGNLADVVTARAEGLSAVVQLLRLVAEEGLDSAEELDARACASAVSLLAGHPEHQERFAAQCVARYALCGNAEDTRLLQADLRELMLQRSKLPRLSPAALEALALVEPLL